MAIAGCAPIRTPFWQPLFRPSRLAAHTRRLIAPARAGIVRPGRCAGNRRIHAEESRPHRAPRGLSARSLSHHKKGRLRRRDRACRSPRRLWRFTTGALVHYVDSMDQLLVEASEYSAREVRDRMLAAEALQDPLISLREVLYLALPSRNEDKRAQQLELLPGFWERSVYNAAVRKVTRPPLHRMAEAYRAHDPTLQDGGRPPG